MNIENALKIEGAMDPPELEWLAEKVSTRQRIVEVGSWQGRSTTVLADNTDGVVFAVDTWKGSEEHQVFLADKPAFWLYGRFRENLKNHIDSGKVCPIHLESMKAARVFREAMCWLDMVFVDASHDYESVKADIVAWKPLLKSGGLLCGHDYGYPPVTRAVQELIAHPFSAGCIWYVEV